MEKIHKYNLTLLFSIFFLLLPLTTFAELGVKVSKGMNLHHIFPKEAACYSYFKSIGIEPHIYTIPLNKEDHDKLHSHKFLASGSRNYNNSWKEFFIPNNPISDPNAKEKAFLYAGVLLSEFGIANNCWDTLKKEFYKYKNRCGTGVKVFEKIIESAQNFAKKFLKANAKKILFVYISYEAMRFAIEADDRFPDFKYVDKSKEYFEKALLEEERNFEKACDLLGTAYINLGLAYFSKYVDSELSFRGQIVNYFSSRDEECLEVANKCFKNAVKLSPENPFNLRFYAESSYALKDYKTAMEQAKEAIKWFIYYKDDEMTKKTEKFLNQIMEKLNGF